MKGLIIICCLWVTSPSFAQSSVQDSTRLTFEDAVKIGLQNNVTLNTQKNQLYATEARKLQGLSGYLPNIYGQGSAQRTNGLQIDPTTGVGSNVVADNVQASVTAEYTLFNGFNRFNQMKQNNNLFLAQSANVNRSRQDVVFNVASQYLQVLLDQELMRIAEENLVTQQSIFDQTKGLVEVGAKAESDLYNQDALLKSAEVTLLLSKTKLENDRALLAQTIQLDPSMNFEVSRPSDAIDADYLVGKPLDSLYNFALTNRQDLKQQNYLVDSYRYTMRANTSGYFPTITLFGSYGSTYFASDEYKKSGDPPPPSFKTQFTKNNPATSYGVNVYIPIFDRLQTRTNRSVNKVVYENAVLTRDNLRKTIKIDVLRSYNNFRTAIETYNASLAQYQAAELALKTQQESYELGVATQVALAQANQVYVLAASSQAQAEVTLVFQKILLDYALGTLNVEDIR
jgi:outer membrane protein